MGRYSKVLEALDTKGLIRFVQDVVRIDSIFDPGANGADESRVTDFVANFLHREEFEVHTEEVTPGRTNIIAFLRGNSREGRPTGDVLTRNL